MMVKAFEAQKSLCSEGDSVSVMVPVVKVSGFDGDQSLCPKGRVAEIRRSKSESLISYLVGLGLFK